MRIAICKSSILTAPSTRMEANLLRLLACFYRTTSWQLTLCCRSLRNSRVRVTSLRHSTVSNWRSLPKLNLCSKPISLIHAMTKAAPRSLCLTLSVSISVRSSTKLPNTAKSANFHSIKSSRIWSLSASLCLFCTRKRPNLQMCTRHPSARTQNYRSLKRSLMYLKLGTKFQMCSKEGRCLVLKYC